jgi:hypothetical protein
VTRIVKFILKKTERKQKPAKPPKPQPRVIEHRSLGSCVVVGVFLTDAGSIVADVDVAGVKRTLALDQQFWLSDISALALEAVKRKPMKPEPEAVELAGAADEDAAEPEESELVPGVDGHLSDGDLPVDEDEDVREDGEMVSADVLR